jgi:hypothetical protein
MISALHVRTLEQHGIAISAYNRIRRDQFGITIGLLNYAFRLHGIQLGLINIAKNNPAPFRVLPVLNVHFHSEH